MLACHYHRHGKPSDVVCVGVIPRPPAPGPGELLVRVHASSLNPADWKSAQGEQAALLKFSWPRVYGFDFSGEVAEVGPPARAASHQPEPTTFAVGDGVFGMIRDLPQRDRGTMAEYILVPAEVCARRPANVSHADCASTPLVAITAVKMFRVCGLEPRHAAGGTGPRVFVTGGAGGMGTMAIQLAKAMFGASFVATTASPAKADLVKRLGADRIVNHREEDFESELANADEKQLFDAVLDCTGEAQRCVSLVRKGGGLCSILAGPTADCLRTWLHESQLDPANITCCVRPFLLSDCGGNLFQTATGGRRLLRACEARGATFGSVIGTGNGPIMKSIADLLESGAVCAVIDRQFSLAESLAAIEYQKSGRAAGKVVVLVPEESAEGR